MITIDCLNCRQKINTYKSRLGTKKYCSKKCYSEHAIKQGTHRGANSASYKGGSQIKTCNYCDKEYEVNYNRKDVSKYCCKDCADKSKIGTKLSEATIEKMKNTVLIKNQNKPKKEKFCEYCHKKIKLSSEYCQQHKHHTEGFKKARIKQSKTMTGIMPKNMNMPGKYGNIKRGYYDINGKTIFLRSKWEANYALYLDFLIKAKQIKSWEYEKDNFIFHKIQSGTRSYRPDFKIIKPNGSIEYHEVKGYMDAKSKTKLKRMKKYYPDIKMVLIDKEVYLGLKNTLGNRIMSF
jgi:hypothetical protein